MFPASIIEEEVLLFVFTAYAEKKEEEKGFKGYHTLCGEFEGQSPSEGLIISVKRGRC